MRVLIATTNPAKVERFRKLLRDTGVELLVPQDLGLEPVDVDEGSDIAENARRKVLAYRGLTDLPILGMDNAFVIPSEDLDPAMVKRNALAGLDETAMSRDEVAAAYIAFYGSIAVRHGGRVPAHWEDAFALSLPDGTVREDRSHRPVTLTAEVHGQVDPHFPTRSLYIVEPSGKYVVDQTPEDEMLELQPVTAALKRLLGVA
ncbi:hypothetical protein EPO33_00540 [Patescibacteria group bacterium]|nr:MAG: hypothetical protein EPO33_00540 [Patescibacteria group bacterium]